MKPAAGVVEAVVEEGVADGEVARGVAHAEGHLGGGQGERLGQDVLRVGVPQDPAHPGPYGQGHGLGDRVTARGGEGSGPGRRVAGADGVAVAQVVLPGDAQLDGGFQGGIARGVVRGVGEGLLQGAQRLPGGVDHGEPGPYPVGRGGVPCQDGPGGAAGEVGAARPARVLGGGHEPGQLLPGQVGRRPFGREQPELGGQGPLAAAAAGGGRLGDLRGEPLVGGVHGQRAVAYGLDGIVDGGGEGGVSGGAFGPARVGGQRGGQRARGELHRPVLAHADQRGPFRLGQLGLRVGAARAAQQCGGGPGREGGEQQGTAGSGGGRGEEAAGHFAGLAGDGQGVGVVGAAVAGPGEGLAEGEGEARVPAAGLVDPSGEAGGQAPADQQLGDLVGAERGDRDGRGARTAEGLAHRGSALDAFGHQDPYPGRGEAQGEAEQIGALRVEPLGVVEDEEDGLAGGEGAEHLDDGEAQCDVVAARPGRVGLPAQLGDGGALGAGEPFQCGARDGGKEGGGGGFRYPLVGGLGGQAQHGLAAGRGRGRDGADQLGLARSGGSCQQRPAVRGQRAVDRLDQFIVPDVRVSVPRRHHAQPPASRSPAPVPFL